MLKLTGLSKTYPNGVRALDDVSLEVSRGMFGLLGPNGAGKSTLMRTIATLQSPDSGSIALDGLDVLADPTTLRRRLGYLPQEFGAYPRTSPEVMLTHIATLIRSGRRHGLCRRPRLYGAGVCQPSSAAADPRRRRGTPARSRGARRRGRRRGR